MRIISLLFLAITVAWAYVVDKLRIPTGQLNEPLLAAPVRSSI
jgi:hypothetical protein